MQSIQHPNNRTDLADLERRQREQLHKAGRCSHSHEFGFCAAEGWSYDPERGWRCLEHVQTDDKQ